MGKIIKYEWKKQRTARLIILFGLLVCMIAFSLGLLLEHDKTIVISLAIMNFGAFLVIFYTGIESLLVFNKDLRTKQSHMLWMIPKSVWEIMGAKFIAAILQMLFVFVLFLAAGGVGISMALAKSGGVKLLFDTIKQVAEFFLQSNLDWGLVIQVLFILFLAWTEIIMAGFLAIVISRTLLLKSKFAGLFSIILFFIITWAIEKVYALMSGAMGITSWGLEIWDLVYYAVVCGILFVASCLLADKKLSV